MCVEGTVDVTCGGGLSTRARARRAGAVQQKTTHATPPEYPVVRKRAELFELSGTSARCIRLRKDHEDRAFGLETKEPVTHRRAPSSSYVVVRAGLRNLVLPRLEAGYVSEDHDEHADFTR